ncbi:MAG: hypothetical protein JW776_07555 [Candidatus Lokiarchaeota archaeon]|nr:hypothetical protein [Candidatus Lokiarchaeota archaeon]
MSSQEKGDLEKKIDTILAAVQNFGLNFIQKLGELKHAISILSDQVEKMNKALITVKGLEPKINEITSMKQDLLSELHYLQSQVKVSSFKNTEVIQMKTDDSSPQYLDLLAGLQKQLKQYSDLSMLIHDLEEIKKKIYEVTGGHRVLFEIGETIKQLNSVETLTESELQNLNEKLTFWSNKLKS